MQVYEPRLGHGLPHDPFNAIVGPRPIGWISTRGRDGVLNLATRSPAEAMNLSCAAAPPNVDEFVLAGLTPMPSNLMQAPRVGKSPVAFECRVTQVLQLKSADGSDVPTWLTLGEVVAAHIARRLLAGGVYDTAAAQPILRGGGPADYFEVGPQALFKMRRPTWPLAPG